MANGDGRPDLRDTADAPDADLDTDGDGDTDLPDAVERGVVASDPRGKRREDGFEPPAGFGLDLDGVGAELGLEGSIEDQQESDIF